MRFLLAIALLATAGPALASTLDDTFTMAAALTVASDRCPGHSYDAKALESLPAAVALSEGWSPAQIKTELESTVDRELAAYETDADLFCRSVDAGKSRLDAKTLQLIETR
ncbi:hypothetical protein EHS39_33050 [Ensifer sp. MPMI2T]|nr:hypothetical protein EHS39_33050 [Ensifer sp. MPMI2T]